MADTQQFEPQPGVDGPASDLYWYKFFNHTGYDGPFKQDRHFVQWDIRPFSNPGPRYVDGQYVRTECSLTGQDGHICVEEARVYCPTCDKYFCLVHHYLIHLVENDNLLGEKTA